MAVSSSLRAVLFLGVASAVVALPAAAQARRMDTRAAAEALARLHPESIVRVEARDGRRVQGRLDTLTPTSIRLSFDGSGESVDLDRLSAVWVRGRHTKAGAIAGGVAGLGLGVFTGLFLNAICGQIQRDDCRGARPYLLGSAIFIPAGALVGTAIGAAIPKWRRIFP
jgi:hypothetical protein